MPPPSIPPSTFSGSGNPGVPPAKCKWCGERIYFTQLDSGKWLPYDFADNKHHECKIRPASSIKKYYCQYCNVPICWNDSVRSYRGRCLPLNADGTRHWCQNNPVAQVQKRKKELERVSQGLPVVKRPFTQDPPETSKPENITPEVYQLI